MLAKRRKAAALVLRRRMRAARAWQGTLGVLLLVVVGWAALVLYGIVERPGDLTHRVGRLLSGQTKEAFLLGWLTYVGWRLYFLLSRARQRHRADRLAITLLQRRHPRWYQALT